MTKPLQALTTSVDSTLDEWGRRWEGHEVEGVTDLCIVPFLVVRGGRAEHFVTRDQLRFYFADAIGARRLTGVVGWRRTETNVLELGPHSALAIVHWNASDADGEVIQDFWNSFQLLTTPEGWRFLSNTLHY